MSGGKPAAALSPALLFPKGRASPAGFLGGRPGIVRADGPEPVALPPRLLKTTETRTGEEVRLSFRLDPARHYRMKLAMAHLRQSGQTLVIAALDHYLDQVVPSQLRRACHCLGRSGAEGRAADAQQCCGAAPIATLEP